MANGVEVACVMGVVSNERSEFELALGRCIGSRRNMPDLDLATKSYGEMATRRRKRERCDRRSEREVVDGYPSRDICQDRVAIFVDGQEEVAAGCKADTSNVFAMSEGEGVRFIPGRIVSYEP